MKVLFRLLLLVFLVLFAVKPAPCQPAPAPSTPSSQPTAADPRATTILPIRVFWDYLTLVKGSIGDFQDLDFEVDTGAYPSIIDERIAHRLGLPQQPARVNLSKGAMQAQIVVLPSLRVGPIVAESLPVLVQDLSYFQRVLGHKVDAIVGLDLLRQSSFTIDYKKKHIVFGPIGNLSFSAPFDTELPVVTIRARFHNRQFRLVVDTGSPDLMLLQSRTPELAAWKVLSTETADDAAGTLQRRKLRIPEVYFGDQYIGEQITFVVDDQKDQGDDFDGVLGIRGPQFSKIAFDFNRRLFWWNR